MSENLSAESPSARSSSLDDDDLMSVLRPDGTAATQNDPGLEPRLLRAIYTAMLQNRLLDERMTMLQRQGRIGFYIGSIGEEASIIGSVAAMRAEDWIFPCYREHGAALWRGLSVERFVHNLMGTSEDPIQGRQMPCHEAWKPGNFSSISSPIATQIPQAVGAAWAARLMGHEIATLTYFGDGATSANDFHVGANFAGVARTATILFCRNNHWAISVPREKQTAAETLASKADGYGIRGVRVDGNDVLAVYAATAEARKRGLTGGGPTLIEAVTYRVMGHSTSDDPRVYRKDEDVAPWKQKDPILRFRTYLEGRGLWSEREESEMAEQYKAQLAKAIKDTETTPPPTLESMFQDVYDKMPWHLREQLEDAKKHRKEG